MIKDRVLGAPNACSETFAITGARGKTSVAHALAQGSAVELPCGVIATGELKVRFSDRARVVEALREWQEGRR